MNNRNSKPIVKNKENAEELIDLIRWHSEYGYPVTLADMFKEMYIDLIPNTTSIKDIFKDDK